MKKIIIVFILSSTIIFAWEINTHRAIDKTAIAYAKNFTSFLNNSALKNFIFRSNAISFDDYGMTYIKYILDGEGNGLSNWDQKFSNRFGATATAKDLIEAGTILEDAQWPHWMQGGKHDYLGMADGRFVNHFEDGQTSKALIYNKKGKTTC